MTRIRPRVDTDLDACVALLRDVHETSDYPAHWPADPRRWLAPRGLVAAWVADDGGIVGHVGLNTAGDALEITRLCVASTARGRKLGERLLATAGEHAAHSGQRLILEVLAHNTSAIALYDRLGWRHLETAEYTLPDGRVVPVLRYAARG